MSQTCQYNFSYTNKLSKFFKNQLLKKTFRYSCDGGMNTTFYVSLPRR